jgi:hypothetical protein
MDKFRFSEKVNSYCFGHGIHTPVSSTNKTDRHNITEILLKVALSTINQTNPNRCCAQNAQKPEREGLPRLLRMPQTLHGAKH